MNVSEQLLNILTTEGVRHIFGVSGDALNPLVSAIAEQDKVKWINVNHEGNGSYAAFAQGELGNNIGVCASTVGPGALHLVNGLYNAKKARTPVLAITGQVPVAYMGTNHQQEVDLKKIFDDICAYQAIIRSPEEAPRVILRAIRVAINERAVCRIELPTDIAEMDSENSGFVHKVFRSESKLQPSDHRLRAACDLIDSSERVAILAGAGCREAREEALAFAHKLKAPITTTLKATDIFDRDSDHVVGLTGLIGNPSGYNAVMDCDALIMLGTDFPYTDFLPDKTKTIQVDLRAENIGNRTPVDVGLHGDVKSVVAALTAGCHTKDKDAFLKSLRKEYSDWKKSADNKTDTSSDLRPMHPQIVAKAISETASDDAIFIIETGASAIWASNFMSFHSERRIIGSFNHGSMGVGLPAAIGAQLQFPNREVWAIVGDGAFNMSLHDLSTAAKYELPIKIAVLNNSELGFVKIEMEEAGLAPNLEALDVNNFAFDKYAELCGGMGSRAETPNEAVDAVHEAKSASKPFVIDAIVNSGELSLPPKITLDEIKNFGMSKVKELLKSINGNKKQWENVKKEVDAYFN